MKNHKSHNVFYFESVHKVTGCADSHYFMAVTNSALDRCAGQYSVCVVGKPPLGGFFYAKEGLTFYRRGNA